MLDKNAQTAAVIYPTIAPKSDIQSKFTLFLIPKLKLYQCPPLVNRFPCMYETYHVHHWHYFKRIQGKTMAKILTGDIKLLQWSIRSKLMQRWGYAWGLYLYNDVVTGWSGTRSGCITMAMEST